MKKVCSKTAIWIFALMLIVPGSILHGEDPPSNQDQAVRDGQPASTAPVPPALRQALASSLGEATSIGAKVIPAPPTGSWGIVSEGDGGGGIFRDSDSEAEVWLGSNGHGVQGFGSVRGGYFKDSDGTGYAHVGAGDYGIRGYGTSAGGYFQDSDSSSRATVGYGNNGILASGSTTGGFFQNGLGTGETYVSYGNRGIEAYGTDMGGYFGDLDGTGYAYVGYGDRGIEAWGSEAGGYFKDINGTGYAYVGYGGTGIYAYGYDKGIEVHGYEKAIEAHGNPKGIEVHGGVIGIEVFGQHIAGIFEDSNDSGYASLGTGDTGVFGRGNKMGGSFSFDSPTKVTWAHIAEGNYGINTLAEEVGGYFLSGQTSSHAYVGWSTYKIAGSGTMAFVQNHPYDHSSVIVYAAPEGDEVATYTRGTARLVDGEATVPLGETFKWVTNPDIGLTAHITPRGEPIPMAVVDLSTEEMIVRAPADAPAGLEFDYIVYGLRIGFEELSIVQEKKQESYIPSMADHRQLYERRPDLKTYNSIERFKGMQHAINPKARIDLSRAHALRDAIIEFDPAVHELSGPARSEEISVDDLTLDENQRGGGQGDERVRTARADHDRRLAPGHSAVRATIPLDEEGNVYAASFRPSSQDLASLVDVSEEVKPGDVLVVDQDHRGLMRRGSRAADNGVVGIVADTAGVVPVFEVEIGETEASEEREQPPNYQLKAPVAFSGVVDCKVDASYGAVWTGSLLVTSPTPGHAMAQQAPLPGTVLGKALEPLEKGAGTIKVLVMLR